MRKADGVPSICTAFLVGSDLALTAAHCIPRTIDWVKSPTFLSCGQNGIQKDKVKFETTKSGNVMMTEGVLFDETFRITKHILDQESDQAVLKLAQMAEQKPLPLITAQQEEIHRCWISGFGINNQNYIGVLFSSILNARPAQRNGLYVLKTSFFTPNHLNPWYLTLKRQDFASKYREIISGIEKETMTNSMAVSGDSGGPLICQKKNGEIGAIGVFRSVGIHGFLSQVVDRKYDWDWFSYISPINFELVKKMK